MSEPISGTTVGLPAPALRPFITRYAGGRHSGLEPGVHIGLPSTDAHLIISLGRPIEVLRMPNSRQRPTAFAALVTGMQDAPALVRQGTEVHLMHIFLRPAGIRALLGVPNTELSSLVVHLSDLWGNCARDLVEALLEAGSWSRRFAILDRAFLAKLQPSSTRSEIAWAWQELRRTHGAVPIRRLAEEIGWSRRHFAEQFQDAIGLAPKSAARVFRFERACRLIMNGRPGLAEVAASSGYFDQAHMTREWQSLAGCTPRTWIAHELPFLQDYELNGCENERDETDSIYQSFV